MTLRLKLAAIITVLGLVVGALVSVAAIDSYISRNTANDVAEAVESSDLLASAALDLLREADAMVGASFQEPATLSQGSSDLTELATTTKTSMTDALDALRRSGTGESGHRDELQAASKKLSEARDALVSGFQQAVEDRDASNRTAWDQSVASTILTLADSRREMSSEAATIDPTTGRFSEIKDAAAMTAMIIAQERSFLASLIYDELPISPRNLRSLADSSGRFTTLWRLISQNIVTLGLPEVNEAYDTLRIMVEERYLPTRQEIIQAGLQADDYPVSLGAWLTAGSEVAQSLETLTRMVMAANGSHLDATSDEATTTLIVSVFIAFIGVVVVAGSLFVVNASIMSPLRKMTDAMRALADGNTEIAIPGTDRKDEIGAMASAVGVFKENALHRIKLEEERAETEQRQAEERRKELNQIATNLETRLGEVETALSGAVNNLDTITQQLGEASAQSLERSTIVSSAAQEAASNVQIVAAAAEEMNASIAEISQQISSSLKIADQASSETSRAQTAMNELVNNTQDISNIVKMITDIAEQTNLLALNATIEAARAGDAGKGFAVVASEVKNLASQTAKATEQIVGQIDTLQASSQTAAKDMDSVGQIITDMSEISTTVAAAMEEQAASTAEITSNVAQASNGTTQVSESITDVSAAAKQTSSVVGNIRTEMEGIGAQVDDLRRAISDVVASIRAA